MTYQTMLQDAAQEKVLPLAATVQKLTRDLARIDDRIKGARDDLDRSAENLARHKGTAVEKLASSTSSYLEWQARLGKLTVGRATAVEALALLDGEIRATAAKALDDAKRELRRAVVAMVASTARACEKEMAECIAQAVDTRAVYLSAVEQLCATFGQPWTAETSGAERLYPDPQVLRYKDAAYATVYFLGNRLVETLLIAPALRPLPPGTPVAAADVAPAVAGVSASAATNPRQIDAEAVAGAPTPLDAQDQDQDADDADYREALDA